MTFDDPVKALHEALASAIHRDLPDVHYERKRWKNHTEYEIEKCKRRPYGSEVDVILFQQLWGSTSIGYGGVGGAAMTYAYTVICVKDMYMAVYFGDGGYLAYIIDTTKLTAQQNTQLETYIECRNMPDIRGALNTFAGAIKTYEGYIDE